MAAEVVVKLAVFDWTGTLADFGACGPATAYVKAFAARGIPVTLATARTPTGLPRKEHVRVMLTDPIVGCCWRRSAAGGRCRT